MRTGVDSASCLFVFVLFFFLVLHHPLLLLEFGTREHVLNPWAHVEYMRVSWIYRSSIPHGFEIITFFLYDNPIEFRLGQ